MTVLKKIQEGLCDLRHENYFDLHALILDINCANIRKLALIKLGESSGGSMYELYNEF